MVQACQVVNLSGILNGGLKNQTKNVPFLNGLPSQVIRPFEPDKKVSEKSNDQISGVQYSDG